MYSTKTISKTLFYFVFLLFPSPNQFTLLNLYCWTRGNGKSLGASGFVVTSRQSSTCHVRHNQDFFQAPASVIVEGKHNVRMVLGVQRLKVKPKLSCCICYCTMNLTDFSVLFCNSFTIAIIHRLRIKLHFG